MRLHHRIAALTLTFIFIICAAGQAAGIEYRASDPVLYVDEKPIFILDGLSLKTGVRDDGGAGMAWLDIFAGDATALKSSIGLDPTGIFAALGGVPSAYGVSSSSLALLTGAETAEAAYEAFSAKNIAEGLITSLNALLTPIEDGSTASITVPLSAGESAFDARGFSGQVNAAAISAALSASPAFSAVISAMQVFGGSLPETGEWSISGAHGAYGDGETESLLWQLRAESGEKACDAELILDKSASPHKARFTLAGTNAEIDLSMEMIPGTVVSVFTEGHIGDLWFETELQAEPGVFMMGSGAYDDATDSIISATVICDDSDFYYAVSRDDGTSETCVYLTSDTIPGDDGSRSGIVTLGLYDATGRVELVSDLCVVSGEDIGSGRKVDAAYATEIFAVNAEALSGIQENIVNVINGAMYVISLYVPGFTYDAIDSLDITDVLSSPEE